MFVNLEGEYFLFTAAHVTDHRSDDHFLALPVGDKVMAVQGGFAEIGRAGGRSKESSMLDASYYHISSEFGSSLQPWYQPITCLGIDLLDKAADGDLYSVAGYPESASKITPENCSAEFFALTGAVPHGSFYRKLGYRPEVHVITKFNVRRSVMLRGTAKNTPNPWGMSGGGIFSWPRDADPLEPNPEPKLIGITTVWHQRHAIFAGTRMYFFIQMINLNNPGLLRLIPVDNATA